DGAREIAGMYLTNKVQNIRGAADTLLDLAGIDMEEIRPVAEAMERGGRLAAKEQVSDALLDKCKPIAGTPSDCIAAIEEYRDAGRATVLGTWAGTGGGPTLMFNGHLDTSYSGREPWLQGIPGFQPRGFERDGRIYGLGISNMKGAVACYVEAVRALQDAGIRL